jgi:hypothetical protein
MHVVSADIRRLIDRRTQKATLAREVAFEDSKIDLTGQSHHPTERRHVSERIEMII